MPYKDKKRGAAWALAYSRTDKRKTWRLLYNQMPRAKFNVHKATAKQRGIAFLLTFEQWWSLWEPHWSNRGVGVTEMVMARTGDVGAYEVGNVRIITNLENIREKFHVQAIRI